MTATLEGVSGQQHALAALYPWERPFLQKAEWAPGLVWTDGIITSILVSGNVPSKYL